MVMVPTIPSRWVKGEDSFDLTALPEPMPRPHNLKRQHRSSTRRRDGAIEPWHEHYVHLSLDQLGRPLIRSSPSLTTAEAEYILGVDACQRFLECLPANLSSQNVHPKYDLTGLQSMPPGAATFVAPEINADQVAYPFHRQAKRRRSSTITGCGIPDNHHRRRRDSRAVIPTYRKTVSIRVGETEAMEKWYRQAFHAVQQVSCRLVAKLWIKRIHLKKQSTHPYNGNFPRDKPRDPNRTRPYYWPENVRHKEPDHITRNERVAVLIEIISRTPLMEINSTDREKHFINAEQLLESLDERRSDIPDEKWEILKDIVKARTFQEKFGRQEIDAQAEITLLDCCIENHKVQADGETDADLSDDGGHLDPYLEGGSSAEQTTDEETSMTPISANLPSPLDKVQKGSGQSTRIESNNACTNFQESFTSDASKVEDSVGVSETYPRSRRLNRRRQNNSQHVSPRLEMTHERFEDDMFGATNVSEPEPNSMVTLDGLSNQRHHEATMQPWQISSLPPGIFIPAYDNSSNFRAPGIAMSMEDQLVFEEAPYRHNTASTRQDGMISSMRFAGPPSYSTGFETSNQTGLPMRPASGPRQDLMSDELAMSSNTHPYYHLS